MRANWYIFDCNNTFFGGHSRMLVSYPTYKQAKEDMDARRERGIDARLLIKADDAIVVSHMGFGVSNAGDYFGKPWMYVE